MEIAIHVPDDVAAALPWDDVSRHILEQIAQWIAHPPVWLSVQRPQQPLSVRQFPRLDDGELEAIPLAQELGASFLLMDDFEGREEAERRALTVTGTLGVLETAAIRGLIACPLFWSSFRRQRFMPHNVSMTRCWPVMRPASLARQRTGVDGAAPLRPPVAAYRARLTPLNGPTAGLYTARRLGAVLLPPPAC